MVQEQLYIVSYVSCFMVLDQPHTIGHFTPVTTPAAQDLLMYSGELRQTT